MVKYSDDTEYEQIDLATMYELRDARLVKARIVSIDPDNNCAEVTIAELCEELVGKDLSAVPFFYHCEDSTGTLEDLARGHKAFMSKEYVYCLWVPASGALDERFYIVGHADIKGIKFCKSSEVLLLLTDGLSSTGYSGQFFCLLDALTGYPLNVKGMDNFDSGSPAKPADYWGEYNVDVAAWITYNFINPTTAQIEKMDQSPAGNNTGPQTEWVDNGSTTSIYTGTQGTTSSGGAIDCSSWFSAGNGAASMTSLEVSDTATHQGTRTMSNSIIGAFASHGNDGPNICRAYFSEYTGEYHYSYTSAIDHVHGDWIEIRDDFDDGGTIYYMVGVWESSTLDTTIEAELDSDTGAYSASYDSTTSYTLYFGFFPELGINRPVKSITVSGGHGATFSGGWSDVVLNNTLTSDSGYGTFAGGSYVLSHYSALTRPNMVIGMKGVYFITTAGVFNSERQCESGDLTGATNSMTPFWPNNVIGGQNVEGTYTDNSPYCYATTFEVEKPSTGLAYPAQVQVVCQALVSPFDTAFPDGDQVLVRDAVDNFDALASTTLSESVEGFFLNIYQFLDSMTGVSDDRYEQFFLDCVRPGLILSVKTVKGS